MSGLLLCGKRATNPYRIEEAGINVYSIEELCYYLFNNTYMVGTEFFTEQLVEFLKDELELPSLAQKIKYGIDHKAELITMVLDILSSNAYYTADDRKSIERTLIALGSKSKVERLKARADVLLDRRRFISAANAYKEILNTKDEVYDTAFVAAIWNNIGVAYTKQFLFEDAAKCFMTACDIDRKEEYFDNMVCAVIFSTNDELMADVSAQYQITEAMIEHYLKAIESNKKMLVRSKEFVEVKERLIYDGSKEFAEYKEDIQKILDLWKTEYRQETK